jgi:hypothetical protein
LIAFANLAARGADVVIGGVTSLYLCFNLRMGARFVAPFLAQLRRMDTF